MTPDVPIGRGRAWLLAGIALAYGLLAAAYTHPLLADSASQIASDPYDPILNTSILWWNATTLPFSPAWWTPPFFHPSQGIAAFTENLVGLSPIATPIYWLTGDPIRTYNWTHFLTVPLSAFAVHLLVWYLGRRHDAAFVAGLAFGFTPYRLAQIAHIQVLALFWLPIALFALHAYLADRRRRWLVLFGIMWIFQALANLYFMLFAGVVIACWLVYFCSTRETWRALPSIGVAWAIASAPVIWAMLKYRAIHDTYGLERPIHAIVALSARPASWLSVTDLTWFWPRFLGDKGVESNLFPGLVPVALVAVAAMSLLLRRSEAATKDAARRRTRIVLGLVALVSLCAAIVTFAVGPWRVSLGGMVVRMSDIRRAVAVLVVTGVPFLMLSAPVWRRLRERSAFAFYAVMTVVMMVLACGPQIRSESSVLLEPTPYRWLMMFVPGFDSLRVPTRIWMVGALCLSVSAGIAFAWLIPRRGRLRIAAAALVCAAVMLETWPRVFPMRPVPGPWPVVEPPDPGRALIELPLGPDWDAAATFRSIGHRRRVMNGVSGHDPPHYQPLQIGLNARELPMLEAVASLGPIDAVVDASQDGDGSLARYVESLPGVTRVASDGIRTVYRLPDPRPPVRLGEAARIVAAEASTNHARVPLIWDNDPATQWQDGPQRPGQWVSVDLGSVQVVTAVQQSIGRDYLGFPRRLAIDVSSDGAGWKTVWEGPTAGHTMLGAIRHPRSVVLEFVFEAVSARYVRLSQAGKFEGGWAVAEVRILKPAS